MRRSPAPRIRGPRGFHGRFVQACAGSLDQRIRRRGTLQVSCVFKPDQLATVLALREGQNVTLVGTVMKYDHVHKVIWLEDCTRAK